MNASTGFYEKTLWLPSLPLKNPVYGSEECVSSV